MEQGLELPAIHCGLLEHPSMAWVAFLCGRYFVQFPPASEGPELPGIVESRTVQRDNRDVNAGMDLQTLQDRPLLLVLPRSETPGEPLLRDGLRIRQLVLIAHLGFIRRPSVVGDLETDGKSEVELAERLGTTFEYLHSQQKLSS